MARKGLFSIRGGIMGADEYRVLNVPRVSVYQSVAQGITTATISNYPWDTVDYDTDSMWTSTGGGFWLTANTPGLYACNAWVVWASNATSYRQLFFYKWIAGVATYTYNNSIVEPSSVTSTGQNISAMIALNKGDQVTAAVSHNIGVNLNITAATATVRDNGLQACLISTLG